MKGIPFPLRPGEGEVIFRFTIPGAFDMERQIGCNPINLMTRGQIVYGVVVMTCYALKHDEPKMTLEKAGELVQKYLDEGGTLQILQEALIKALNRSGVYGQVEEVEATSSDRPTTSPATVN